MKISESALVAMSMTALSFPRHSSAFSPVPSSSLSFHASPSSSNPSSQLSSTWHPLHRRGTSLSVGKGARDLGLLTDTPLSDADQERINEKMAIEEVKDFLRSLPYRVAGKTKAGTPVGFVSMGDFAADASRSAELEAEAEIEAEEVTEQSTGSLPKLRTTLGSSVFLSNVLSSSSSSTTSDALLLLNLLNANSLVEDSPTNFRFDVIAASVPPEDVASTKKKVVSREARYNGLLDKLRVLPEEPREGGVRFNAEELRGMSSWIVQLTKEEATGETISRVSSLLTEVDELKNVVVLVEGVDGEAEGVDFLSLVGWDELKAQCVALGKKCTLLLVGELYDGDAYNLYHVGKLDAASATGTAATSTTTATSTTASNADDTSSTTTTTTSSSSKLARKEAYRILASALSLESTANTSLYLRERPRTLDATTAAVSVDPFEELFPFPTYTGGPDDDDAWLAYKKECYVVQEKRKEARIEAEKTLGKEKAEALEEEQALKAVEGKLPRQEILEDRLIVGMREMGFSRTMELDVLVDSGVLAYKKYIAKPTPLADQSTDQDDQEEEWNQPSPEEILIITKNKKRKQEAATLIQSIAYEWARRKYWETEIQGDLMLYDPIAEKEYVANLKDEAMAFATEYYNKEYKMGRDQAEFEKFKEEKARQVEEREKAIFDKVKRKMLAEMDVDMFATIENLANIESEKKKAEYKYGQEVEYWWIGDPEDPERYQGVNVGPR